MIPKELRAKPGDKILDKFKKLVAYIDAQKLISVDERVQISETANGTNVMLLPKTYLLYDHPLKITLIGDKSFRVADGYVNNELPYVRTTGIDNKILHRIDSPKAIGTIPKNKGQKDTIWYFFCTILATKENRASVAYIECMNEELAIEQDVRLPEMILGKSKKPRNVDSYEPHHEFYIPMGFMRADRVIHNFTWHNIYARLYVVEKTNRIIFYPG